MYIHPFQSLLSQWVWYWKQWPISWATVWPEREVCAPLERVSNPIWLSMPLPLASHSVVWRRRIIILYVSDFERFWLMVMNLRLSA